MIPNRLRLYGSVFKWVTLPTGSGLNSKLTYDVSKTELYTLDKSDSKCNESSVVVDVLGCVVRFVESKVRCRYPGHLANLSLALCETSEELNALFELLGKIEKGNEKQIQEVTGCVPSCHKEEYQVFPMGEMETTKDFRENTSSNTLNLLMVIPSAQHYEIKEYTIYTWSSLVADVGGVLGLLLGQSILGLFFALSRMHNE